MFVKRAETNKGVIKNYVIIFVLFIVLSLGLIFLDQFLISEKIIQAKYSWLFIVLRYVIAILGLLWINRQIIKSRITFAFKFDLINGLVWLIVIALIIYNLWGITLGDLDLSTSNQEDNFLFCLGPAIFEELWFRGIIFERLTEINYKKKYGLLFAIVFSSFLFMISHVIIPDYTSPIAMLQQCIGAFCLGILFAVIYFVTNNLGLTMLVHFTNNLNSYFSLTVLPLLNNLSDMQLILIESGIYLIFSVLIMSVYKKINSKNRL